MRVQYDVLHALILRELQTRFGLYRLGYAWALIEPVSLVLMFGAARSFFATVAPEGIDFILFLFVGIMPWLVFTKGASRLFETTRANRNLFQYQMVKPFDAALARLLLEVQIILVAFALLWVAFSWWGYDMRIDDPLMLILLSVLLFAFVLGAGLIGMVLVSIYPELRNAISIPMRLLFWLSGIFYSVDELPSELHIYLLWNPMLHFLQLSRVAYFDGMNETVCSLQYVIVCSVVALWLGLVMYRANLSLLLTKR